VKTHKNMIQKRKKRIGMRMHKLGQIFSQGKSFETLTDHRMFVILLESEVNQFQLISTSSKGKGICDEVQLTYVLVD
jgi:hypothetical protein